MSGKGKKYMQDVTQEQRIRMCSIMLQNPKYACNEEEDCMERIRISGQLVTELNALEGAKKDFAQWWAVWQTLWRISENQGFIEGQEIIHLVAQFHDAMKRAKKGEKPSILASIIKQVNELKAPKKPIKLEVKKEVEQKPHILDTVVVSDDDDDYHSAMNTLFASSNYKKAAMTPRTSTSASSVSGIRSGEIDFEVLNSVITSQIHLLMPMIINAVLADDNMKKKIANVIESLLPNLMITAFEERPALAQMVQNALGNIDNDPHYSPTRSEDRISLNRDVRRSPFRDISRIQHAVKQEQEVTRSDSDSFDMEEWERKYPPVNVEDREIDMQPPVNVADLETDMPMAYLPEDEQVLRSIHVNTLNVVGKLRCKYAKYTKTSAFSKENIGL